ncbi:hypothetical protein BH09GEM1_BH09GEM1_48080 [soil metagenome]
MRTGILLLPIVSALGLAHRGAAQTSTCLTVRDAVSSAAIASALVRVVDGPTATQEIWSDSAGKACWPRPVGVSARGAEVYALGYRSALREIRGDESLAVPIAYWAGFNAHAATSDADLWQREQFELAVSLAQRELARCVSLATASCGTSYQLDIASGAGQAPLSAAASAGARERLSRSASSLLDSVAARLRNGATPPSPLQRDSGAMTLAMFLDPRDVADRYVELRLTLPVGAGHALFGATEMTCHGSDCDRSRQLSFAWEMSAAHQPTATLAMTADGATHLVDVFHLVSLPASAGISRGAEVTPFTDGPSRSVVVRGTIRDDKGNAVRNAQVVASPGEVEARTDTTGLYSLALHTTANAIVLTARTLGYAPSFKTILTTGDTSIAWEPQLRRFQLLAARVVTGKGEPAQLSSWRYEELMTRRASGRGFFLVGKEISSSSAIGDALARAPGLRVKMKYGNTIQSVQMSKCTPRRISEQFIAPDALIGVWVNGIERTVSQPAEAVLGDLLVAEVIAIEVYNGVSEIPAEFVGANYCGVVSVWTK